MKRKCFFMISFLLSLTVHAQQNETQDDIDWKEDSTEIISIADIVKEQQKLTTIMLNDSHKNDVWRRRSFTNISFLSTKLSPKNDIPSGIRDQSVKDMKNKWGVSIQSGRSYRLHLKPIANMVQFNLDYSWIDLGLNYFDQTGEGNNLYDSNYNIENDAGEKRFFMPWNLKKYELNYGMTLGPSVSVAPLYLTNVPSLHYLLLHFYYHIGYHVSGIILSNDQQGDINQATGSSDEARNHTKMADMTKIEIGHGIYHTFGFSLTWKGIGLGFEKRISTPHYKPLSSKNFVSGESVFSTTTTRFYIQFRM